MKMVKTMTKHVMDKHPDTAKAMEKMHNEDPEKWGQGDEAQVGCEARGLNRRHRPPLYAC